ncbi:MAG: hypothetical protein SFZ03_03525 [Candidatus Melainabacteria bacterium]|nr:hypothetical protein [Candidatus Melainabacteria bacterium]
MSVPVSALLFSVPVPVPVQWPAAASPKKEKDHAVTGMVVRDLDFTPLPTAKLTAKKRVKPTWADKLSFCGF